MKRYLQVSSESFNVFYFFENSYSVPCSWSPCLLAPLLLIGPYRCTNNYISHKISVYSLTLNLHPPLIYLCPLPPCPMLVILYVAQSRILTIQGPCAKSVYGTHCPYNAKKNKKGMLYSSCHLHSKHIPPIRQLHPEHAPLTCWTNYANVLLTYQCVVLP